MHDGVEDLPRTVGSFLNRQPSIDRRAADFFAEDENQIRDARAAPETQCNTAGRGAHDDERVRVRSSAGSLLARIPLTNDVNPLA